MEKADLISLCPVKNIDGSRSGFGEDRATLAGKEFRGFRRKAQVAVLACPHDQQTAPFLVDELGLLQGDDV